MGGARVDAQRRGQARGASFSLPPEAEDYRAAAELTENAAESRYLRNRADALG